MPFLDASISASLFLTNGVRTFFFLDLMFAMCFIPLNSSRILCIFSCLLALLVVSYTLFDLFADLVSTLLVFF